MEKLKNTYLEEATNYNSQTEIGHYFEFQAIINYENSGGNTSTVGVLKVEFDVNDASDYSTTPRSKDIQFSYTVQP